MKSAHRLAPKLALCLVLGLNVACDDAGESVDTGAADAASDAAVDATVDLGPRWLDDPEGALPATLSGTGVFADLPDLVPAPGLAEYEPASPLWSSGSLKQRLLYLPAGELIDAADPEGWRFPVGTVLVKTFSYDGLEGRPGLTPLETRLLFKRAAGWDYAVYQWGDDRADATLLEGNWVEVPLDPAGPDGAALRHTIPARLDCRTCHETAEGKTGTPVLGVDAFQLDPRLAALTDGADAPLPIVGRFEAETAALRYLLGNCVTCHNGGDGPNAAFSLRPDVAVANTVGVATTAEGAEEGVRIVAGDVTQSVLYMSAVHGRDPDFRSFQKPMPPLGIDRTDPALEPLLRAWIEGLP